MYYGATTYVIASFLLEKRIILSGILGCFYLPVLYFFVEIMEKIVRAATSVRSPKFRKDFVERNRGRAYGD
jgi:hypothetical protein